VLLNRRAFVRMGAGALIAGSAARRLLAQAAGDTPLFERVQPDLFAVAGAQPNCWADYNNDGHLDLFVGFKDGLANRLYRYDGSRFTDVASDLGLADLTDTRAAAWGDFNADGHLDLYVGFTRRSGAANKLYRNDGDGRRFTEIGRDLGIDVKGETRQVSWIDFDNDGRVDLFVAFRDAPNMLFHNEGSRFVDVAKDMAVDDPRKTVGAVWFDMNDDGRLDLYTANQDGTLNGFFRNDGSRFVDVARELGMDASGRPPTFGSNGPSVIDYDNDGRLDLFVAGYGRNFLFHNEGKGRFKEVAESMGVAGGDKATPSAWGDYDNDGRPDLYVSSYVDRPVNEHDFLYHNEGRRLANRMPEIIARHGASHGVQWVDFDGNGALDLALANNNPTGGHYVFRNQLPPERARRSIQVQVLDDHSRHTRAGSEVRVYAARTRQLLGTRIVDTGSGYCSQSVVPVHVGLPIDGKVDVEVTAMTKAGRKISRVAEVDPNSLPNRILVVNVRASES
jgi:penicillin G amidase